MSEEQKIIWKDKEARKLFLESGFEKIADFLDLKTEGKNIDTHSMREHLDKTTGKVNRKMTRITIEDKVTFFKQLHKK